MFGRGLAEMSLFATLIGEGEGCGVWIILLLRCFKTTASHARGSSDGELTRGISAAFISQLYLNCPSQYARCCPDRSIAH